MAETDILQPPRTARVNMPITKGARLEYIGAPPTERHNGLHPAFWHSFKVTDISEQNGILPKHVEVQLHQVSRIAANIADRSWRILRKADWRVLPN